MENDTVITGSKKSVTIIVSRTVFPGHESDYDEWVRRLVAAAREAPGNTGVTMLIPEAGKSGLHHVVMNFADEKSMHIWETSYTRQKLSHEADAFSRSVRQAATGLETWFSIPECPELETPPQWKMAIVTFIGVYLLSIAIIKTQDFIFKHQNFYLSILITGALLVGILTWIVMPLFSRYVFRKWLYK